MAQSFGKSAMGIILTGIGKDGTAGAKKLRASGGKTIAQDEESSLVFGMPRSAIANDAVDVVHNPDGIAKEMADAANVPRVLELHDQKKFYSVKQEMYSAR
jgi:two-component system chemotaxis response regulator CheB